VLVEAVRRLSLSATELANATAASIRLKPLKIGAVVAVSLTANHSRKDQPQTQHCRACPARQQR
jgi:hypothetical protein